MKVVVCGSRRFDDPLRATAAIVECVQALPPDTLLIHGDAPGADRLAAKAAENVGIQVRAMPARWNEHVPGCRCGNRSWCMEAGKLRNLEMLDLNPDLVIAFWNGVSNGTRHTLRNAQARGIPTRIVKLP